MPFYVEALLKLGAVVVGALVGGWLVGALVGRLVALAVRRQPPRFVVFPFRLGGAVAGGWLVWLLVIGHGGGFGLFGGGDSLFGGPGGGSPGASTTPDDTVRVAATTRKAVPPAPSSSSTVRVTLLGGSRVVDDRFYLLEGRPQPETLNELKQAIKEQQAQKKIRTLELLIYENSVARNHPAVTALESWAEQNNLTVSLPPTRGDIP